MSVEKYFPFWDRLSEQQQQKLRSSVTSSRAAKGALLHRGSGDCVGLFVVVKGVLRAYILTEDGRELTLYRLLERDVCLLSASCIIRSIQFEVFVEAEQDAEFFHIPAPVYQALMQESAAVANYTNELLAARFSEVMWVMDQILSQKLDARLAAFLMEQSRLLNTQSLPLTHEGIARNLGSAREVIGRMLHYFQDEEMVSLSRGRVVLLDLQRLERLSEGQIEKM